MDDGTKTLSSTRCETIPIELFDDQESAPDATTSYTDSITSSSLYYRDFASSTTSTVSVQWNAPPDFDVTSITAVVGTFISSATGPDGEGVAWHIAGCTNVDNTAWGCTPGEFYGAASVFGTSTQYAFVQSSKTEPIGIPDIAPGKKVILTLSRAVDAPIDDYAQKVGAVELNICYNIN